MKFKILLVMLLLLTFLPGTALACFDEYGYNQQARMFIGTLDNWEAFLFDQPPLPVPNPSSTDVVFLVRKWNKALDDLMFKGKPPQNGAWCSTYAYMNMSGDKIGWKWHNYFIFAYLTAPPQGAVPIEDMPGFYYLVYREWLTDPSGRETVLSESFVRPPFPRNSHEGIINHFKSFLHRPFIMKGPKA